MIFPFIGALDFFLGFYANLPLPFQAFVSVSAGLFAIATIIRLVLSQ